MAGDATENLTALQDNKVKKDDVDLKISDLADGTLSKDFELAKDKKSVKQEAVGPNDSAQCQLCVLTGNEYHPFT